MGETILAPLAHGAFGKDSASAASLAGVLALPLCYVRTIKSRITTWLVTWKRVSPSPSSSHLNPYTTPSPLSPFKHDK